MFVVPEQEDQPHGSQLVHLWVQGQLRRQWYHRYLQLTCQSVTLRGAEVLTLQLCLFPFAIRLRCLLHCAAFAGRWSTK